MLKRRGTWLGLSLALHVSAFFFVLSNASTPEKTRAQPIALRFVQAQKPPPAVPKASPKVGSANVAKKAAPQPAVEVAPAAEVENKPAARVTVESFAPRNIKTDGATLRVPVPGAERGLGALEDTPRAFGDDGLDEKARVGGRLGAEVEAFVQRQHTAHGARGTVASLRRELRDRFAPEAQMAQAIPGSPAASRKIAENLATAHMRASSTAHMQQSIVPAQQEIQKGMTLADPCAASHEIGRMETRFRVEHGQDGQASAFRMILSSGDPGYDAYAQKVLSASQEVHLAFNPEEPHPLFSVWALSQIVYDWASTPTCPAMARPPGRPVFPDAKNPWAITFTAEVSLLAVRYGAKN